MDSLIIECPKCKKKLRIPSNRELLKVKCSNCQTNFPWKLDKEVSINKSPLSNVKNTIAKLGLKLDDFYLIDTIDEINELCRRYHTILLVGMDLVEGKKERYEPGSSERENLNDFIFKWLPLIYPITKVKGIGICWANIGGERRSTLSDFFRRKRMGFSGCFLFKKGDITEQRKVGAWRSEEKSVNAILELLGVQNFMALMQKGQLQDLERIILTTDGSALSETQRKMATMALSRLKDPGKTNFLVQAVNNKEAHEITRIKAIRTLGELQHPDAIEEFAKHLNDPSPAIRQEIALALININQSRGDELLQKIPGRNFAGPIIIEFINPYDGKTVQFSNFEEVRAGLKRGMGIGFLYRRIDPYFMKTELNKPMWQFVDNSLLSRCNLSRKGLALPFFAKSFLILVLIAIPGAILFAKLAKHGLGSYTGMESLSSITSVALAYYLYRKIMK